ncbi:hypothetical protein QJS10_CPB04g01763 [Acorus calamus]|uniref:Gustatory receptor n=1 Tax=Acorus calamus TaxID=4465 RepID=A0AAV9F490_ACOCL|nr:hypothetical protein QJS10_CPB04g01763 [Acorus calamus]
MADSEPPLLNDVQEIKTPLDVALERLDYFLTSLGFHQSSFKGFLLSWSAFAFFGVALPIAVNSLSGCGSSDGGGCTAYRVPRFEMYVLASETSLAAASLACVSQNLRKHGIRRFLFVDRFHGRALRFRKEYVDKIQAFFFLLICWMLPLLLAKAVRDVILFVHIKHGPLWESIALVFASVLSWVYLNAVFLSTCLLFNLVCNLQVVHFVDYAKLFEREADVSMLLEEHQRLRYNLSKISHRFRVCLLLIFLLVSASECVTLIQTTGYPGITNFINAGDFAIAAVVQVIGTIHCLHSAAKISHRAQGIASFASTWHAAAACASSGSSQPHSINCSENLDAATEDSTSLYLSESDLESLDVSVQTNSQLISCMSSYNKRQALVLYLQSNVGGITMFGWTMDRAFINTIFFIELSLVTFVLGKTIVFSSK